LLYLQDFHAFDGTRQTKDAMNRATSGRD